jgi:hypothetical protein
LGWIFFLGILILVIWVSGGVDDGGVDDGGGGADVGVIIIFIFLNYENFRKILATF